MFGGFGGFSSNNPSSTNGSQQFNTMGNTSNSIPNMGTNTFGGNGTGTNLFGGNGLGTNTFGGNGLGTSSFGGNTFGTNSLGGSGLGTNTLGTNTLGTNTLGTNAFGGNTLGTNTFGGNTLGTNTFGGNTLGTNSLGTNTLGTNSLGGNGVGTNTGPVIGTTTPQDFTKSRFPTESIKNRESIQIIPESNKIKREKKKQEVATPTIINETNEKKSKLDDVFDLSRKSTTNEQPLFLRRFNQTFNSPYRGNGMVPLIRPSYINNPTQRQSIYSCSPIGTLNPSYNCNINNSIVNSIPGNISRNSILPNTTINNQTSILFNNNQQSVLYGLNQGNNSTLPNNPIVQNIKEYAIVLSNLTIQDTPLIINVLSQFGVIVNVIESKNGVKVIFADETVVNYLINMKKIMIAGKTCYISDPNESFLLKLFDGQTWKSLFSNLFNFLYSIWN
ncbi:hypothetical protein EDI_151330 [Entamoeba dispar SAW760]|uniref:Uncharacterized protein n=1 Tax=Entamoeba dispar (strain ATCC PRA-260 / SAW760) TaxID=370354 RepID=B0EQ65_ENTDS|nr:uncharacterized protein EDI_151330 [Entamoeba dispar SAW760]EDR23353.1 hypothetical protein EDI_151330 [Entamoeba dispar SAW760]|eukprot:EDR23353.1 hypothetical protein EDI_151330 [Entamoeba dispar SAW760]